MKNGQPTFNALECVKHLRSVGFTQEQAEAQAQEIERAKIDIETNVATKEDLEMAKMELKREIEFARAEQKKDTELIRSEHKKDTDIAKIEHRKDMIIIVGSVATVMLGLILAMAKLGVLSIK